MRWAELPGFAGDTLFDAWNAWLKSCERPGPVFAPLCGEVRRLSIASADEQRAWLRQRLQPYRVEPLNGSADGLLTGYYEPLLEASRQPSASHTVPLYRPPATLATRRPWYTRQEIDTLPEARAALRGREIAYLADPLDALVLQIQGSGRVRITEADGSQRLVRLAYAGTNDQPYKSVGRWLLDERGSAALPTPGSLLDLVGRRLRGLAPDARAVVEAAAVLGRDPRQAHAGRARGLGSTHNVFAGATGA